MGSSRTASDASLGSRSPGKLDVSGTEMPLKHGHFHGTDFSNGTAVPDDLKFHWAVTEGEGGKRIGSRIAPVNDPLSAQTYRS